MSAIAEKTVRELAVENPRATRVFERLGIDYCCGGKQTLEQACRGRNLSVDEVRNSLQAAEHSALAGQDDRNWQTEPLGDLISHITSTHHKYTRDEIARLGPAVRQGLFRAWSESPGTLAASRYLHGPVPGARDPPDERRNSFISVYRPDGGVGDSKRRRFCRRPSARCRIPCR